MSHGDRVRSRSPVGDGGGLSSQSGSKSGKGMDKGKGGESGDLAFQISDAITKQFAAKEKEMVDSVARGVQGPIKEIVENVVATQLGNMDGRLGRLEESQAKMAIDLQGIKESISELSKLSHSGSLPSLRAPLPHGGSPGQLVGVADFGDNVEVDNSSGFFRKIDPTVLFCNVANKVKIPRARFFGAIVKLVGEAGLNEDTFKLVGDELDDRFEIKWLGEPRTASTRCLQFFQSLQLGRGKWKPQLVADEQGREVQFFVGPDKNLAQVRREVLTKSLREIVKPMLPEKEIWMRKSTGTLFVDKRMLVSVKILGEASARLEWYHPKRIVLGLEEGPITEQFNALVAGVGGQLP